MCAESTVESTYFDPKIRVRGQQCNVFACWTTSHILKGNGECVTLAGGYALPLHRMCARIALPKDDDRKLPADPGYTKGMHLTYEGVNEKDKKITDKYEKEIIINAPKLCLYRDPSFFSTEDGLDLMDLDPNRQPLHKTKETHPIIKAIIFIINMSSSAAQTPSELLGALFGLIDSGKDDETTAASLMKGLMSFISKVIGWVGDVFISLLKRLGEINHAVDSKEYGCVNLPLGPLPPPYCEKVAPFSQVATISNICPKDSQGNFVKSTGNNPCVVSKVDNNFINNSVRVGYETLLPLCRNNEDPMTTDSCVVIENLGAFSDVKAFHVSTAFKDIIKPCKDPTDGAPCVRTMWPHKCSVTSNGCQDGFRIVYGEKLGSTLTAKQYFNDDLDNCSGKSNTICQEIWGVNIGEFVDISLQFPKIQESGEVMKLVKSFTLVDRNDKRENFDVSIVRISGYDSTYSFTQETNQLCVFDTKHHSVIGCSNRVKHSGAEVRECSDDRCVSSYFSPKFIVYYDENKNKAYHNENKDEKKDINTTSAVIEPLSVHRPSKTKNVINLAGNEFESFVTDDTMITKPFSGDNAPNPSSIFGVYQDNILPFAKGVVNNDAVYISGLEYINGSYHLGGKLACLTSINDKRCPEDIEMCVLTNLLNTETVLCSDLSKKSSGYGGLKMCVGVQNNCPITDSISKRSDGQINIRDCGVQGKCYDGGVELCKISENAKDRIDPSASYEEKLEPGQFYDPSANSSNKDAPKGVKIQYNQDTQGLRNKTPVELGLCVTIPQGTCSEENDYSESNGYAYWPETPVGKQAIGTCQVGWHALQPLKRYCVPFSATETFGFEPLDRESTKKYTDIKCVKDKEDDNKDNDKK